MFSGYCFDEEVNAITILDNNIIVVGGNFNYIHINYKGNFITKKVESNILSLSNDGESRVYVGFKNGNILIFNVEIINTNYLNDIDKIKCKKITKYHSQQDKVDCLLYVNKFKALYSGCNTNRAIQMWDKDGNYIISLDENYGSYPQLLSYSLTYPYLYSAHKTEGITIWNAEEAKYKKYLSTEKIVAMESYNENLIACNQEGNIKIIGENNFCIKKNIVTYFKLHSMTILNNIILVGTQGGIIKYYDMEGRHEKDEAIHKDKIIVLKNKNGIIFSVSLDNSFKIIYNEDLI